MNADEVYTHTYRQTCATPDVCSQTHLGAHECMYIKALRNSSDLIPTLGISPNSLKSQLCLESHQVPKLFTWFPLLPVSCCKEIWMVTPAIATFCIKRWKLLPILTLFLSISLSLSLSLSLSRLQAACNTGQEAAAFPLPPLCTGLKAWHREQQRKLSFRF